MPSSVPGVVNPLIVGASAGVVLGAILWLQESGPRSDVKSIVALPAKIYGSEELGDLTDAVSATLSTYLAQVQGLETMAPPSSVEYQCVEGDFSKVARVSSVTAFVMSRQRRGFGHNVF